MRTTWCWLQEVSDWFPRFHRRRGITIICRPTVPDALQELNSTIDTIPITSADAERGFSTTNIICSSLRSRLSVERLSSLIFISLVGPPLMQFNPLPYVKKWLAHDHRGAYDNQSTKRHATEESRYSHLNKIFEWHQLSISEILLGTIRH